MNLAKEYKIGMNMTYPIENGEARSAAAPRSDKKRLARFTPSSDGLFLPSTYLSFIGNFSSSFCSAFQTNWTSGLKEPRGVLVLMMPRIIVVLAVSAMVVSVQD